MTALAASYFFAIASPALAQAPLDIIQDQSVVSLAKNLLFAIDIFSFLALLASFFALATILFNSFIGFKNKLWSLFAYPLMIALMVFVKSFLLEDWNIVSLINLLFALTQILIFSAHILILKVGSREN
jgi:hypothetical protein